MLRVRTRDIELVRGNAFGLIQNADGGFVVLATVAEDVADHRDVFLVRQLRQLFVDESARANVLQPDRVQHSGSGLKQARRRIADHRLTRQTLGHKAAQLFQRDDIFKFDAVTKRPTGGQHRILKTDSGKAHAQVRPARCLGFLIGHEGLV